MYILYIDPGTGSLLFEALLSGFLTINYFSFWKFTNTKIEAILDSINKQGNYRIILTGDHGYRRNEHKENYHYSFTAFKGFDSTSLKQIESIQDIGILINAGFKK